MKAWLKGGLILLGLDILFWIGFFIYGFIVVNVLDKGSDISGLALAAIVYYGALSILPSFIIGTLIGSVSGYTFSIEKKIVTLWTKIGFLIGLIWPLWVSIYRSLTSNFSIFDLLSSFFRWLPKKFFATLILSIIITICSAWVFWVVGALIGQTIKKIIMKRVKIICILIFSLVLFMQFAVAVNEVSSCCEKTKLGLWCQNAPKEQCDAKFLISPTLCESTSYCKKGCCYDSSEGICMENTAEGTCKASNGSWSGVADCKIPQCSLGCCVLGTEASYTTLQRCKKMAGQYGLQTDFRTDIKDELSCLVLATSQDVGACIFESEFTTTCKFTTRGECNTQALGTGVTNTSSVNFYQDYLCTNPEFNTNCERTTKTTCKDGKVYFVDTCGNTANIYDSSKINDVNYWSKVKKPEESCQTGGKNCGNCEYLGAGTICAKASGANYGDYICKDVNCYNTANGKDYKNGESWCYYDNRKPDTDSVGSRHYRHLCFMGEEIVEPCADFRKEVCVENFIGEKEDFSQAGCVANRWQYCVLMNKTTDCLNNDQRDCMWIPTSSDGKKDSGGITESKLKISDSKLLDGYTKRDEVKESILAENLNIKGDERYAEGKCVPKYATGLSFWSGGQTECSVGTQTCIVKYEKGLIGGKKCVENCDCLDESTAILENYICSSYGDCGAKSNYIGVFVNKGYEIEIVKGKEQPKTTGTSVSTPAAPGAGGTGQTFGGEPATTTFGGSQNPVSTPAASGNIIQGLIIKTYNAVRTSRGEN